MELESPPSHLEGETMYNFNMNQEEPLLQFEKFMKDNFSELYPKLQNGREWVDTIKTIKGIRAAITWHKTNPLWWEGNPEHKTAGARGAGEIFVINDTDKTDFWLEAYRKINEQGYRDDDVSHELANLAESGKPQVGVVIGKNINGVRAIEIKVPHHEPGRRAFASNFIAFLPTELANQLFEQIEQRPRLVEEIWDALTEEIGRQRSGKAITIEEMRANGYDRYQTTGVMMIDLNESTDWKKNQKIIPYSK